jgi:hypothetical protein
LGQSGGQGAVELYHGGAFGQQGGQPDFPGPAGDLQHDTGDHPHGNIIFDEPEYGGCHGVIPPGGAALAMETKPAVSVQIRFSDFTAIDRQGQDPRRRRHLNYFRQVVPDKNAIDQVLARFQPEAGPTVAPRHRNTSVPDGDGFRPMGLIPGQGYPGGGVNRYLLFEQTALRTRIDGNPRRPPAATDRSVVEVSRASLIRVVVKHPSLPGFQRFRHIQRLNRHHGGH